MVFAVPLAVRVFAEPGWPLSYRTAVANRVTGAENVPRAPYELLAERMQVDVAHAFVYLTMTLVIPSIIFVMRRRWRVAMIPFIVFAAWAVAVALLSPQNQRQATELWWVTGWWSMACGAVAALAITMVVSRLPRFVDVAAAAAGAGFVLAAAGSLFTGAISGSVGVDGSYVPDAVRTIEERSDGRRVAVLVRSQWLMVEMGLVLALARAGRDYCVLLARSRTDPG